MNKLLPMDSKTKTERLTALKPKLWDFIARNDYPLALGCTLIIIIGFAGLMAM